MRTRESAWTSATLTIFALLCVSACSEDNLSPKSDDDDTTAEEGAATGDDDDSEDDVSGDQDGPPGNMDAGRKDGGSSLDAGRKDGGAADASRADGGRADGGRVDATTPVTGIDGGAEPDASGPGPVDEPGAVTGCGSAKLLETNAEDTGVLGPWPVGVKTLKVPVGSSALTVEVWYPAKLGSAEGKSKETYDLRSWLPTGATKIPDSVNKLAVCNCYRDLPLDTDHGPYPAVLFIHGLGSMRVSSMSATALWASRGFVVVAADHPGDMLTDFLASADLLGSGCTSSTPAGGDMASEANTVLTALRGKTAGFDFLGDVVDLTRIGLAGHSQGGGTVAGMSNTANVKIIMTLAPLGGGALNAPVDSMLQVTGTIDSVTGYSTSAYNSDRSKIRRHVGIRQAGHIDVTDLCKEKNPDGKTAIEVARDEGVCGALILSGLAQCGGDPVATEVSPLIVNYATTAALEETLQCKNRDAAFAAIRTKFPQISEFLHSP